MIVRFMSSQKRAREHHHTLPTMERDNNDPQSRICPHCQYVMFFFSFRFTFDKVQGENAGAMEKSTINSLPVSRGRYNWMIVTRIFISFQSFIFNVLGNSLDNSITAPADVERYQNYNVRIRYLPRSLDMSKCHFKGQFPVLPEILRMNDWCITYR